MTSRIDIEDMTDAQDEAPERIWADRSPFGEHSWMDVEYDGGTLYVRADLARPSQAGDERVEALVTVARRQVESMCEGFCKNLPSAGAFTEDMDHDCAVCRMRAALAAMDTPKGGGDE